MPERDSKQAEKDYLRRTGASAWDLHKPFSPPGTVTLDDSRYLFQDFAAAVMHLTPRPADRVLDLAAGVCWCSDWLQRLNVDTVSIDISHDMLTIGRSRLPNGAASHLVTGDLEALPFARATFDKADCLSAIHHVPDIGRAIGEIARVLKDDGVVLFSEPGVGHTAKRGRFRRCRTSAWSNAPGGQDPVAYLILLIVFGVALVVARITTGSLWAAIGLH